MNTLGVYLGPDIISIVETKGKKLVRNIEIPRKEIATGDLEDKVPEDVKMVTFLGEQMQAHQISAQQVHLALSGKDLIIRTFEMPVMFRDDLSRAITFEAKKYIPFKTEELIVDYRVYYDKPNRKNIVLLVGIKKETLEKYLSVFKQLNLKVVSLEYAAFSALRLLTVAGIKTKGVMGVIEADLRESDEINFIVLENGFPLFSRDIILVGGSREAEGSRESDTTEGTGPENILEKLKTEARISLDYYHRKFPSAKNIDKTFFITSRDYQADLEALASDIGLSNTQLVDAEKHIGKSLTFSLSFFKAYGASISKALDLPSAVDLISAKIKQEKEKVTPARRRRKEMSAFEGINFEPPVVVLAVVLCLAAIGFGLYYKIPLGREISDIKAARPPVATVDPDLGYEELYGIDAEYARKLDSLDKLVQQQLYLTYPLNVIPQTIPEGIWLIDIIYLNQTEENKLEFVLQGAAYFGDKDKEIETINRFVSNLKANKDLAAQFREINIRSIGQDSFERVMVTNFAISCKR